MAKVLIESRARIDMAAQKGKKEVVNILLACKVNVNFRNINNLTAIHHASEKGHAAIAMILIKMELELMLLAVNWVLHPYFLQLKEEKWKLYGFY